MGVQGLWDILHPAGSSRSLAALTLSAGFVADPGGTRSLRVGIDASLWYQHATRPFAKPDRAVGANPELRTLFFKLCNIADLPISPLFIFDGRERPKEKRKSRMGKSGSHMLTKGFKEMLRCFGMGWRMARGEAEAELAHLNSVGAIDAILTDDVDALLFGATMIIRNSSMTLTGNRSNPAKNLDGKPSKAHTMVYTSADIASHRDVRLSRGGLILIALLSGGDYDTGIRGFGVQIAHALARLGHGDTLLTAYEARYITNFDTFLAQWRAAINTELHTNASGLLPMRYPALSVPMTFPNPTVLETYANPVSSVSAGGSGGGPPREGTLSLPQIARFCEEHFDEWGYKSKLLKRLDSLLTRPALMTVLRRAAVLKDEREKERRRTGGAGGAQEVRATPPSFVTRCLGAPVTGSSNPVPSGSSRAELEERIAGAFVRRDPASAPPPSSAPRDARPEEDAEPLFVKIVGTRTHVSMDQVPEFRVEVCPAQLVRLSESGIRGKHAGPAVPVEDDEDDREDDDGGGGKRKSAGGKRKSAGRKRTDVRAPSRYWLPEAMMRAVHPGLVKEFEDAQAAKSAGATTPRGRKEGKARARADDDSETSEDEDGLPVTPSRRRTAAELGPSTPQRAATRPQPGTLSRSSSLPVDAVSSLPLRPSGFLMTWPDPDDPDRVVLDSTREDIVIYNPPPARETRREEGTVYREYEEGARADVESAPARVGESSPGRASASARARPSASRKAPSKPANAVRAGTKRKRAAAPPREDADADTDDWQPAPDTGRFSQYDTLFNRILGITSDMEDEIDGGGRVSKRKKRQKESGNRARGRNEKRPTTQRTVTARASASSPIAPRQGRSPSPALEVRPRAATKNRAVPRRSAPAPFPDLPLLDDPSPARVRMPPTRVWSASSPISARRDKDVDMDDGGVISLTDSDDDMAGGPSISTRTSAKIKTATRNAPSFVTPSSSQTTVCDMDLDLDTDLFASQPSLSQGGATYGAARTRRIFQGCSVVRNLG